MIEDEYEDAEFFDQLGDEDFSYWGCPDCGAELDDGPGGGVKCPDPRCGYWFCY